MHDRLLGIKRNPFLEDFLTRGSSHQPDNLALSDLLWKYHKKNNNYLAAAKILAKLAERHSTDVNLKSRVEYLSRLYTVNSINFNGFFLLPKHLTVPRAIVCIKSEETGGGILDSHRSGAGGGAELLHDLEEQMEVARVQLSVADAMIAVHPRTPEVEQAIAQVGYAFFTFTR